MGVVGSMAKIIPLISLPGSDLYINSTMVWSIFTIWTSLKQMNLDYVIFYLLQNSPILDICRQLLNATLYETDMLALLSILIKLSHDKQIIMKMLELKYPVVLIKELGSFNPPVSLASAKILVNCFSVDEEVDKEFVQVGIIQVIEGLFEKQKIKEYSKLCDSVTFMIGNLLCSSPWVFEHVCNSTIILKCVELLSQNHADSVDPNLT